MLIEKRPKALPGITIKTKTACGSCYVTINTCIDNGEEKVAEVFFEMGKQGGCPKSMCSAIGRLSSAIMRAGLGKEAVIKHLKGIRCEKPPFGTGRERVLSCADAIAKTLEDVEAK